jgi:CSLREA domain-containing protein
MKSLKQNVLVAVSRALRMIGLIFIISLTGTFPMRDARAASILVNSTADTTTTDGQCTLREALANADADSDTTGGDCLAGSGADTITFDLSIIPGTIILNGTALSISSDLTIAGPDSGVTIDGNGTSQVFVINSGTVVLNYLIITNGAHTGAGTQIGGGILNGGNLSINNSLIDSNHVSSINAGAYGGGINNMSSAVLVVNNTTIRNNSATGGGTGLSGGGGINNSGILTLNNSTVSGNTVTTSGTATSNNGGGIRNPTGGAMTLNNSTIVENIAMGATSRGGGIADGSGSLSTIYNTIIANNTAAASFDCNGAIETMTNTLLESIGGCSGSNSSSNVRGFDPNLGPLSANGGGTISMPTLTYFPLETSPALGAGNNGTCLSTDQRGSGRPVGTCDIGAIEMQIGEQISQDCTTPYTFPTDVNVNITVNSGSPGCITVLKRPVFPGLSQDDGEFQIVWTLSAQNSPFNLDIEFCYSESELGVSGVSDETSIIIFHLENGNWLAMTTTADPSNNCVSVSGVTSLSPWALVGDGIGTGNNPTSINLYHLTARTKSTHWVVIALAALVGVGLSVILFRSRR